MDFDKIRAAFDDVIAQKVDGIVNVLTDPQMIEDSLEQADGRWYSCCQY